MTAEQLKWWQTLEELENQFYCVQSDEDIDAQRRSEIESTDLSQLDTIWKELYAAETYEPPKVTVKSFSLPISGLSASATTLGLGVSGFSLALRVGYLSITIVTVLFSGANADMNATQMVGGAIANIITGGLAGLASVISTRIRVSSHINRVANAKAAAVKNRSNALGEHL